MFLSDFQIEHVGERHLRYTSYYWLVSSNCFCQKRTIQRQLRRPVYCLMVTRPLPQHVHYVCYIPTCPNGFFFLGDWKNLTTFCSVLPTSYHKHHSLLWCDSCSLVDEYDNFSEEPSDSFFKSEDCDQVLLKRLLNYTLSFLKLNTVHPARMYLY